MPHPYIPNSAPEVRREMLDAIGVDSVEDLYRPIPSDLRFKGRLPLEEGIPEDAARELARRGHPVKRVSGPWGGGQMIQLDWRSGTYMAGSDPRKDGCALAY